mgnify:CR=1 FL=1
MTFQADSPQQMFELGEKIGRQLKPSYVVVLNGELGAGKTVLTQGIASAFKILGVTSPTFVISRIHKGNPNFIHIDAYRLLDSDPSNFAEYRVGPDTTDAGAGCRVIAGRVTSSVYSSLNVSYVNLMQLL